MNSLPGPNIQSNGVAQMDGSKANRSGGGLMGSDKDEHGCRASAGERWCPSTKSCLSVTETCPPEEKTPMGSDKDEHGCRPSAGERWCPSTNRCLSVTQPCPPAAGDKKKEPKEESKPKEEEEEGYGAIFLLPLLVASLVASVIAAAWPSSIVGMLVGVPVATGLQSLVLRYWPGDASSSDRYKAMWMSAIIVVIAGLLAWLVTMRSGAIVFGVLFVALLSAGQLTLARYFSDHLKEEEKEKK